jgi:hypothetical protein
MFFNHHKKESYKVYLRKQTSLTKYLHNAKVVAFFLL